MFRIPATNRNIQQKLYTRMKYTSSFIRSTFIEYFAQNHGHKHVKSSSVVPLCDPTLNFVNAGMNQFKGVFLGKVEAPCPRAVNSQKCVRVGGKHNDLDIVGTDGHHHTFFEMLGNWSFGDYYKKEACQMAWDLLLGPYRLKPENLVVTYFSGDVVLGMKEDIECRDIWRAIGVPSSRLIAHGAKDNFWEMGAIGPCGPCTEIHHVNPDGSLTEIWNIVFIQCNRESDGSIKALRRQHVDTGMGLERMAALLQGVSSNYDTDLFQPIIKAIERISKGVPPYGGRYGVDASLDSAYRQLADHARMISVCLADGVSPATSTNLKQIMRKCFKVSSEVFQNPHLLSQLYNEVLITLGSTYPELVSKEKEAKLIIDHEQQAYAKLRMNLMKELKDLVKRYPEVESMSDVELPGFVLGYKEFKETMSNLKSSIVPGELVFKLYDRGFQENIIERIATLNEYIIDKDGFQNYLSQHKSRHKTAIKEHHNANKWLMFDKIIEKLLKNGYTSTNDQHKYDYSAIDNKIQFKPLTTKLLAILNEVGEWIDFLDPCENRPYYLVTRDTNFYTEEGGQIADSGIIRLNEEVTLNVDSVFKIRNFVFHKGYFRVNKYSDNKYVNIESEVSIKIDENKRINVMKNHTGVHLLNAAIRKVLPNSVVCQIGSSATDQGLSLTLSVYGDKLSQDVVLAAQDLIRSSIKSDARLDTRVIDSVQMSREDSVVTIPGETYPEVGLRLVSVGAPLFSKELCCGTHVPHTGYLGDFCVTYVKGAGGNAPRIHALTGDRASEARKLFSRAKKLKEVIDLVAPELRMREIARCRDALVHACGGSGAPHGEFAQCLALLDGLQKKSIDSSNIALSAIAQTEVYEASQEAIRSSHRFLVHFVRSSFMMDGDDVSVALATSARSRTSGQPALLLGCSGGIVNAVCHVPQELVTPMFTAERWLSCILPIFNAQLIPPSSGQSQGTFAEMTGAKVSTTTCEQLVQDAMRIAIVYAQSHAKRTDKQANKQTDSDGSTPTQDRKQN